MAAVYLCLVLNPVIWAINPGVGDESWSTEMHSPGFVGALVSCELSEDVVLHGLLVALPHMHAVPTGIGQDASLLGSMPLLAMI